MNALSFWLIIFFGVIFGYLFPELLREIGYTKKIHTIVAILLLPFLSFIGFLLYPLFTFGYFALLDLRVFYGKITTTGQPGHGLFSYDALFFWITVSLLVGGVLYIFIHEYLLKKKHTTTSTQTPTQST